MNRFLTSRRSWFASIVSGSGIGIANVFFTKAIAQQADQAIANDQSISADMIESAAWIADLSLTADQCSEIAIKLNRKIASLRELRKLDIDEDTPTATAYLPHFFLPNEEPANIEAGRRVSASWLQPAIALSEPKAIDDVAFWTIQQLGIGLRKKWFTSEQLTRLYLDRMIKFDPILKCIVSFNDKALNQARDVDQLLANGHDLGPLHGIPWGAKDIISIPGIPTTWGSPAYRDRIRNRVATVAQRMNDEGAVLLGKLSVGTLAMGDQWFGGMTRNPWNPVEGSSGSSAGSACAVSAGLCGFSLGSETLGSIVSPARRCLTNGLRPSFGRVSRTGCMPLAWSMDKIGPFARSPEDCAIVFSKLIGTDGVDPTVVERDFIWPPIDWDLKKLKVGVLQPLSSTEKRVVELFESHDIEMVPLQFNAKQPIAAMLCALDIEAAAMHGQLFSTAATIDDIGKWGPAFRSAPFITGVDYVRAMRARVSLIRETEEVLRGVDFLIGDGDLARMNLTGHPSLVVAFGENVSLNRPTTVTLTGRFFSEAHLIRAASMLQELAPPQPRDPILPLPE